MKDLADSFKQQFETAPCRRSISKKLVSKVDILVPKECSQKSQSLKPWNPEEPWSLFPDPDRADRLPGRSLTSGIGSVMQYLDTDAATSGWRKRETTVEARAPRDQLSRLRPVNRGEIQK